MRSYEAMKTSQFCERKMNGLDLMQAHRHTSTHVHTIRLAWKIEKPAKKRRHPTETVRRTRSIKRMCTVYALEKIPEQKTCRGISTVKNRIGFQCVNKANEMKNRREKVSCDCYSCTFVVSVWYQFYGAFSWACMCVVAAVVDCLFAWFVVYCCQFWHHNFHTNSKKIHI